MAGRKCVWVFWVKQRELSNEKEGTVNIKAVFVCPVTKAEALEHLGISRRKRTNEDLA
jgi:hypothetical protein